MSLRKEARLQVERQDKLKHHRASIVLGAGLSVIGIAGGIAFATLTDESCSFDGRSGIVTNNFNGSSITLSENKETIYQQKHIEPPATYSKQMQSYCDSGVLPHALENSFK